MTPIRALIQSAQAARHDPNLRVEKGEGLRFCATTHRPNRVGNQTVLTPEPLTGWMSGPELVEWLREAGNRV